MASGPTFYLFAVFAVLVISHSSSAESGFFWHVTDFHYDPTYWTKQLSCNNNVTDPGMFGDYWCDSNWRLVEDSIVNMARIKMDVDFVAWTGDTVAHIADQYTRIDFNMEILENITDTFKREFPNVKFLPSLGNHDFHPSDQADVKQDEMYNKTAAIWKDWIPDQQELDRFMNGGFYSTSITPNVRLMSLNTNLYYNHNKITKNMDDPAGQLAWMEKVLKEARENNEKVVITAHVTPGVLTPRFASWMYKDHLESYVGVLTKYHDVIIMSHYGHDHSDGFKIMQDKNNDTKAIPQFVAPSVTPWRFRAGALTGNPHNPGVRLVEYDKTTGQHLNYVQYYINLTESNTNNKTAWTQLYDFRTTYNVSDMSVKSLRSIFERMEKDNDEGRSLAQAYCNNALVSKEDKECTQKNRLEIVCGGRYYQLDEANSCVDTALGTASSIGMFFSCFTLSALIVLSRFIF